MCRKSNKDINNNKQFVNNKSANVVGYSYLDGYEHFRNTVVQTLDHNDRRNIHWKGYPVVLLEMAYNAGIFCDTISADGTFYGHNTDRESIMFKPSDGDGIQQLALYLITYLASKSHIGVLPISCTDDCDNCQNDEDDGETESSANDKGANPMDSGKNAPVSEADKTTIHQKNPTQEVIKKAIEKLGQITFMDFVRSYDNNMVRVMRSGVRFNGAVVNEIARTAIRDYYMSGDENVQMPAVNDDIYYARFIERGSNKRYYTLVVKVPGVTANNESSYSGVFSGIIYSLTSDTVEELNSDLGQYIIKRILSSIRATKL